jgi:hypothetical protein
MFGRAYSADVEKANPPPLTVKDPWGVLQALAFLVDALTLSDRKTQNIGWECGLDTDDI